MRPVFAVPAGTVITNNATLTNNLGIFAASVDVTGSARTPATIEFLTYAPGLPTGVENVDIGTTDFSNDGTSGGTFAPIPVPVEFPSGAALGIPGNVPLYSASLFHSGEPVFIRVTDLDQNIDTGLAETLFITLTVAATGDTELLRVTETGVNTGIFVSCLQSSGITATSTDGTLQVTNQAEIIVTYTDASDSTDVVTAAALVDPFGLLFDSVTGAPIDGAEITLWDLGSNAPASVYSVDGVSTWPATVISGAPVTDGNAVTFNFGSGEYRFPFVTPGNYELRITPPDGFGFPSAVPNITLQTLPGAPYAVVTGSRGEPFLVPVGPAIRVDVPLDPAANGLFINKTASKDVVGIGDFLQYRITIQNISATAPVTGAMISDLLPQGFRYRAGSARFDANITMDPVISSNGRGLNFTLGTIAGGTTVELRYVIEVTAGAPIGEATNIALATGGGAASNTGRATVTVRNDLFRDQSILMGRVIVGSCDDDVSNDTHSVPGARVYLEDGAFVITDKDGKWHMEGVRPGNHVVQLDTDSLPERYEVMTCADNTRFAGTPYSQFVDLQGGTLWRADFHVQLKDGYEEPVETPESAADQESVFGILSLIDGEHVTRQHVAIRVRLPHGLKAELSIDGKVVPAKRIGFSLKDPEAGEDLYNYIGVNLGAPGTKLIRLTGKGPFGNERFAQTVTVIRTGAVRDIRVIRVKDNIADGRTPVRLRAELIDEFGKVIYGAVSLNIKQGNLVPYESAEDRARLNRAFSTKTIITDENGDMLFEPVTNSGEYHVTVSYGDEFEKRIKTWVKPHQRDWILVGFASGTLAHDTLSGNIHNLKGAEADEFISNDGQVSFYGKGRIKGGWLLTIAYDSKKQRGEPGTGLGQTIDPDRFYTLYGDTSSMGYDAESARKLYLRIERDTFYAMFGDFDTGLTVTELSRYSRSMNGFKSEYAGDMYGFKVFATHTNQAFIRDEIRGDGTSGIYRLTRRNILINSDKIMLETRDRFHSERVVDSTVLSRHIDYAIDYDNGTLIFKSPVASKDHDLNPIFIVANYESNDRNDESATFGGRATIALGHDDSEFGITAIREGATGGESKLYGVDVSYRISPDTLFRAEAARTDTDIPGAESKGNAYIAEVIHEGDKLNGSAWYRRQSGGFGLGQQNGSETSTEKFGIDARYAFTKSVALAGEAYRQSNLATGANRDVIETRIDYKQDLYTAYGGLRFARDSFATSASKRSTLAIAGGTYKMLDNRLTLRASSEIALNNNDENSDFPNRFLAGADYRVTDSLTMFVEQEMTFSDNQDTQGTRIGAKYQPWKGGEIKSSLEQQTTGASDRLFGNLGLTQNWKINEAWSADFSLDRAQTLNEKDSAPFNVNVPPVSGTGSGTGKDDYTAIAVGLGYRDDVWEWTSRLELREADKEDKTNLFTGLFHKLADGIQLSASLDLNQTRSFAGVDSTHANLRMGYVYRPIDSKWIILDRLDFIYGNETGDTFNNRERKIVNNLNANVQWDKDLQVAMQYGGKYIYDTIDDVNYAGYTDLMGIEVRKDISKRWDVGARASVLHSWKPGIVDMSYGVSIGYSPKKNMWISAGYNFDGFRDNDFEGAEYTAKGIYIQFRYKFDQSLIDRFSARSKTRNTR